MDFTLTNFGNCYKSRNIHSGIDINCNRVVIESARHECVMRVWILKSK